mmetsp:Transcript_77804/g.180518  ORF Transcript_77804/g.180518 Transcript_77804/m.180518 type:complete len:82 (+) Transcript_77804:73-318(+)
MWRCAGIAEEPDVRKGNGDTRPGASSLCGASFLNGVEAISLQQVLEGQGHHSDARGRQRSAGSEAQGGVHLRNLLQRRRDF